MKNIDYEPNSRHFEGCHNSRDRARRECPTRGNKVNSCSNEDETSHNPVNQRQRLVTTANDRHTAIGRPHNQKLKEHLYTEPSATNQSRPRPFQGASSQAILLKMCIKRLHVRSVRLNLLHTWKRQNDVIS